MDGIQSVSIEGMYVCEVRRFHFLLSFQIRRSSFGFLAGPQHLEISPIEPSELNLDFVDPTYASELENLYRDYTIQHPDAVRCIECTLPVQDLRDHFINLQSKSVISSSL